MPLSCFAKNLLSVLDWVGVEPECATTVGIIGPQSLATFIVFSKESNGFSCLTPPSSSDWELRW